MTITYPADLRFLIETSNLCRRFNLDQTENFQCLADAHFPGYFSRLVLLLLLIGIPKILDADGHVA
jgi:hypothetical protein